MPSSYIRARRVQSMPSRAREREREKEKARELLLLVVGVGGYIGERERAGRATTTVEAALTPGSFVYGGL